MKPFISSKFVRFFETLYPLVLVLFLLVPLTLIIYSDKLDYNLAGEGERQLLDLSLRFAKGSYTPKDPEVAVITASDKDIDQYGYSTVTSFAMVDLSIRHYIELIHALKKAGVKKTFLHWQARPHHSESELYSELSSSIQRTFTKDKFNLYMLENEFELLDKELINIVDLSNWYYCFMPIQRFCIHDPIYKDWVLHKIVQEYLIDRNSDYDSSTFFSKNLPRKRPTFILNLPPPESIPEFSFSDVITGKASKHLKDKVVFVGNGLKKSGIEHPPGRVLTVYNSRKKTQIDPGTTVNVFFAQITQMLIDKSLIRVAPKWVSWSFGIAISIIILSTKKMVYSIVFFLLCTLATPLLNGIFLRSINFYAPCFNALYLGLCTVIAYVFVSQAWNSFIRWKLDASRHYLSELSELRQNFVSLLSHNLNTPVAQMQGLIDLLRFAKLEKGQEMQLNHTKINLASLQYCIKNVLCAHAIDDKNIILSNTTNLNLQSDISSLVDPILKNLGFKPTLIVNEGSDTVVPLSADNRVLGVAVLALCTLFNKPSNGGFSVELQIWIRHEFGTRDWKISVKSSRAVPRVNMFKIKDHQIQKTRESDFIREISVNLLDRIQRQFDGVIRKEEKEGITNIALSFVL